MGERAHAGSPGRDGYILIAARGVRMFAYGFLSVVLALYLVGLGFSEVQVGITFTVALAGGAATTVAVSMVADRLGRRVSLTIFALLTAASGTLLALGPPFWLLLFLAALGTISPSGYEVGPFQSLEQAALSGVGDGRVRVASYSWYNLVGSVGVALGGLAVGAIRPLLQVLGYADLSPQRVLVWSFAGAGLVLAATYVLLSPQVEAFAGVLLPRRPRTGLHQSRPAVLRLSALFAVDALAGGLVIQSLF